MTSNRMALTGMAPSPTEELDAAYVQHLMNLQSCLRLKDLPSELGSNAICRVGGLGDGLTTVAFRSNQVGPDVIRALLNFRLAQFLHVGLMSASLARSRSLLHEPIEKTENTIHSVCLDDEGRILGYLALVGASSVEPRALDDPLRERFPVEEAHHVDLVSRFANHGLNTQHAWEIKRFVRASELPQGSIRDRVPWHLIAAMGGVALALSDVRLLMGDSRQDGALKHLGLIGFDPLVVMDTKPSLPRDYLMWPSYERETVAKPFIATVPDNLESFIDVIALQLGHGLTDGWQRQLLVMLRSLRRSGHDRAPQTVQVIEPSLEVLVSGRGS